MVVPLEHLDIGILALHKNAARMAHIDKVFARPQGADDIAWGDEVQSTRSAAVIETAPEALCRSLGFSLFAVCNLERTRPSQRTYRRQVLCAL
jgi:hypothetical protein